MIRHELMNYRMKRFLLGIGRFGAMLALLGMLSGCGQPEIQPLIFNAAPWQSNEISTYELTDLNGNYAGTARYDLTRIEGDLWNLRREINSQGTQEIVAVDMGTTGFRPAQSTLIRMAREGTEVVSTTYSGTAANLELTTKQNITTYERISIPSDAREQATLIMLLRALPLAENYAVRLNIFWPVTGLLDRVTAKVIRQEQLTTPAGVYDTWYVQMETPNSETQAWIATEAPYPVVKFIDSRNGGTFALSDFQPGK